MDQRIVTGYDGSPTSAAAVEWAASAAHARRAELWLVGAYQPPPVTEVGYGMPMMPTVAYDTVVRDLTDRLDQLAKSLRAHHHGLAVQVDVVSDSPRHALVARADGAELLVVGASGAGSIGGWVFGSVVQHAIRHSPCPVVIVPGGAPEEPATRIVVGIDGSSASEGALDWAAAEADRRGMPLDVIHAWERPFYGDGALTADAQAWVEVDASTTLNIATQHASDRCSTTVTGHLVEGTPVDSLLEAGKGACLLVVGSVGRGGFRTMLVGSVAQAVAEHAPCPVVVVRRGTRATP